MKAFFLFFISCVFISVAHASCPATPTKPSPFPAAGASTLPSGAVVGGVSSGAMPSSTANFVLPTGSTNHTITSGTLNNDVSIYVQAGQTLTINYSYTINSGHILNIYVDQTATLNLTFPTGSGNTLNGGNFYNFGGTFNLDVQGGIQNASNFFIVGSTATLVAPTVINLTSSTGQFLIDGGSLTTPNIIINTVPADEFCVKNFGCISTGDITTNNVTGTFSSADNFGYVYLRKSYTASPNNVILNTTGNTPIVCTGETPINAKWCNGVASCVAKVKASCTPSPTTCGGAIALPITLVSFKPTKSTEGVQIQWKTALEINSDYFLIEKSTNGRNWTEVAEVSATGGSHGSTYTTSDFSPSAGYNYYRLVEVDKDGKQTSYAVDVVSIASEGVDFHVFPNPSTGNITVTVSDDFPRYEFELEDVKGITIGTYTLFAGTNSLSNVAKPGVYFAKLKVGTDMKIQKIVVQ